MGKAKEIAELGDKITVSGGTVTVADISASTFSGTSIHSMQDVDLTGIAHNMFLKYNLSNTQFEVVAGNTSSIDEGTNLYYTDARVASYLSSNDFDTATNIVASITDSAPGTLDTLNELAAALGDDPNFATTTANNIATKLPLAGGAMTGDLTITSNANSADGNLKVTSNTPTNYPTMVIQTSTGGNYTETHGLYIKNTAAGYGLRIDDETTDTSPFVVDSEGRVGIGTDSPSVNLEIKAGSNATTDYPIGITNSAESLTSGYGAYGIAMPAGSAYTMDIHGDLILDVGGNVGIGNPSPGAKLEVADSDGGISVFINNTQSWSAANLSEFSNTALVINPRADGAQLRFSGSSSDVRMQGISSDLTTAQDILLNPFGGEVGIGTTSTDAKLHVKKGTTGSIAKLEGNTGRFIYTGTDAGGQYIEQVGNTAAERKLRIQGSNGSNTYTSLTIDGANQRVYTDGNAKVGIGTATPDTPLEISKDNGNAEVEVLRLSNGDNTFTNSETEQAVAVGFELQSYEGGSRSGRLAAKIVARKGGAGTNDWYTGSASANFNSQLDFYTRQDDVLTKQMILTEDGRLGINTSSNLGAKLNVSQAGQNSIGSTGHISHKLSSNDSNYNISRLDTSGNFLVDQYGTGGWRNSYSITANNDAMSINDQLFVDKGIYTYTDSGTKYYTHLCTLSTYSSTGAIVINTNIPGHNVSGNANMFSFRVTGFWYNSTSGGAIDMTVGCYSGEGNYYNTTLTGTYPASWKGKTWFATNSNGKVCLILGTTTTSQECEIAVTDFVQGFVNVNASYAKGWSAQLVTSLSVTQQSTIYTRNPGGMQIIDGTARTALYSSSGTFTVSQTNTFTPIGTLSDFKIDVHVNVNVSDDEGGGNMNPYANGVIQRSINGGSWTTADNTGISNQGAVSCHVEMSPPRVGTNANTDTYMTQQDRYRTKNHSSTFIDRPSLNMGDTIQYRLICNLTNGNHIQIGEPLGYNADDNYMAQPFGFIVTEFTPWE